jgi:hypothetical protein
MNITTLTPQQLRDAADLREQIDALQEQLNEVLGGEFPGAAASESPVAPEAAEKPQNGRRKKRRMTAAWKRALARARKARLEKIGLRAAAEPEYSVETPKTGRSAAWRRAKSKAMKAFWAARRAAGKTGL